MKIGIISAHKHCKNHLLALRSEGYDVHGLGGRPTKIAPSYDVLIVRSSSCSHRGFDTAMAWGRETALPLIHENGLTGIRRELSKLTKNAERHTPQSLECPPDLFKSLTDLAVSYVKDHPMGPRADVKKFLQAFLHKNHQKNVGACTSMIPSILATLFAPPLNPEPKEALVEKLLPNLTRGPLPNAQWTKVNTPELLEIALVDACQLKDSLMPKHLSAFRTAWDTCEKNHSTHMRSALRSHEDGGAFWSADNISVFQGNPRMYTVFVYLTLDESHVPAKRTFTKTYKSLTGKSCDTRLPNAVAWYLNLPEPLNMENPKTRQKKQKKQKVTRRLTPDPLPLKPVAPMDAQEANTNAILEVMEDLSAHKSEVQGVCDRLRQSIRDQSHTITALESKLDEAIKAGFDPRTNLKLSQMEKRIGDLLTAQLQNHKHEVNHTLDAKVGEMREELRGEVSDTFDTLSAEWSATDDVSASPFAALERIKATLKAAGFKGTLTLTIE